MARANRFDQLISTWDPILRKAFTDSIYVLRDQAQVDIIVTMLEQHNVEGALKAVGLDPVAFRAFDKSIINAFEAGGNFTSATLPVIQLESGFKVKFQFNIRNPAAERWLSEHSSKLITEIMDDQRSMIRGYLMGGMAKGVNPTTSALDLVGRVGASGRREGGVIGLTTSQSEWVRNYAAELASDNPTAALSRTLRDKRFDKAVIKAAESGEAIPAELRGKMVDSYTNRALRFRAESIARTEAMASLHAAQENAMAQAVEGGAISRTDVTYIWHATQDDRTRDSHAEMDGQTVGMGEMFTTGNGAQLEFPGDPSGPPEEVINCFHPSTLIAVAGLKEVISRRYSGELIELSIASGINFSVTPNHPVLTKNGWVLARDLVEGDDLINGQIRDRSFSNPDIKQGYASAQRLSDLAHFSGCIYRPVHAIVNFHGEVPDHHIEIISFPSELRHAFKASGLNAFGNLSLEETDILESSLLAERLCGQIGFGSLHQYAGVLGLLDHFLALFRRHLCHAQHVGLGSVSSLKAKIIKAGTNYATTYLKAFSHLFDGDAFGIKALNFGQDALAFSRIKADDISALNGCDFTFVPSCEAEISEARGNHSVTDAERAGYLGRGQSSGVHLPDIPVKWNTLFRPTRLVAVRRFNYDGLVFNFETDNGLILAHGIVTHNCRCWREPSVDFLANLE